jgi:hypothetical protein
MTHKKLAKQTPAKVARIADEQMPQSPFLSHSPVSGEHLQYLLDNSVARAYGYGMVPTDTEGRRLMMASHGKAK